MILLLFAGMLSCQMCSNYIRNSKIGEKIEDIDSLSMERVFISDRLQDSLMNFLRLFDTTDFFIISKTPGKFCRIPKPRPSHDVVTLCCFTIDNDTIINFYGSFHGYIGLPASTEAHKIFVKKIAVGAKRVNNTLIAVNAYGDIAIDSVFDSLFLSRLDLAQYDSIVRWLPDVNGNIYPLFKEYVCKSGSVKLVFSNERNAESLDTVKCKYFEDVSKNL